MGPSGDTHLRVTRDLGQLRARTAPTQRPSARWTLLNWLRYRRRDVPKLAANAFLGVLPGLLRAECVLRGSLYRPDLSRLAPEQVVKLKALLAANVPHIDLPRFFGGDVLAYGVMSRRVITTAGVNALTDAFQGLFTLSNFKFHGFGTGTAAEATGNTALGTEMTTQYATDNTRPTGSQTEGAANIYRTVGTFAPDSGGTIAITEHGLFDQAAVPGGTLWDRSVFAAVNLDAANGDSLQVTHDTTLTAGG